MSIGSNIKRLRTDAQLSQSELGKIAGVTDKAVSTWEADIKTPRMGAVEKMATYFGVPKSAILDDVYPSPASVPPGFEPLPKMVKRPLVGSIACGEPITAEENIDDYVDVPENVQCDFCLRCKGDSPHRDGARPIWRGVLRNQLETSFASIARGYPRIIRRRPQ